MKEERVDTGTKIEKINSMKDQLVKIEVINKVKKKLLFVIDSLDVAGAEKSLVTLLTMLDYDKYAVDLQLFSHGHALEKLIPKEVNILESLPYTSFTKMDLKESINYAVSNWTINMLRARLKYSMGIRKKRHNNPQKAILYWQSVSRVITENPNTYDIAISYAQGVPTYYTAEKVKAKKKFAWVNVSYHPGEAETEFQRKFYDQYNKIVAVSDSTREVLLESFPGYKDKVVVIFDINHPHLISQMSEMGTGYTDDFAGIRILTVGRLANQKGYDLALEACKRLKEKGVNFRWYVLGKGPLQSELEALITANDLAEHFVLLGVEANPYPYFKQADLYVQTSRFEGFGLAIAEARMLNVPIVTTRFDAVHQQMVDGKNGLIVDIDADAVAAGIIKLIDDQNLKENIIKYLTSEKKGNMEEIAKFYQLIG